MLFDGIHTLLRPHCRFVSKSRILTSVISRRSLLTLAIETSCDDTCVAVLGKKSPTGRNPYSPIDGPSAKLFFNEKITSNNTGYGGIHPLVSLQSHRANLSALIDRALYALPDADNGANDGIIHTRYGVKHKPDFVTVTRGPGMRSSLSCGLDTAKGLSVAWQIPLMAVHHMQAHALTPRLVNALEPGSNSDEQIPQFPFLTLLVSGGHTLLVHSKSLVSHEIMASTQDIAIGDALDKIGRILLPEELSSSATDTAFAKYLSKYAFQAEDDFKHWHIARSRAEEIIREDNEYGWKVTTPLADTRDLAFSFSGLASHIERLFRSSQKSSISPEERVLLARTAIGTAVEHLGSRTIIALKKLKSEGSMPDTLVISGGVASNDFLRYALRKMLNCRGFSDVQLIFPPVYLCTDNAAMIAWTGIEMNEAGFRSGLDTLPQRKWSLENLLQPEIQVT